MNNYKSDYVVLSNRPMRKEVWDEFLSAIRRKYGKIYGHVSDEIERAIVIRTQQLLKEADNKDAKK